MNQNYYKYLLESLNSGLIHIKNGKIEYFHLGLEIKDFIKSEVKSGIFIEEVFSEKFIIALKEKLATDSQNEQFDFEINNQNQTIWLNVKIRKIESPEEYILMVDDITERKTEEQYFKLIFENAVMGIYRSTPGEGRHLSVNPELARIYGYDSTEELLNSITDISNQLYVNKSRRQELLNSLFEEDSSFGFESQLYRKDGELIWISENARAVKDSEGKVKFIVGTVKDITERKLAEEKIRQAKEDWERTFDSIENIIVILDKDLRIRRMNKAAQRDMLYKDLVNSVKNCAELFNCGESKCLNCPAKKTSVDKKVHSEEIENLYQGRTYFTTSSPIFDEKKELQGIVFIAKDVTEEKRLQQQAEYRLQQVIQTDKLKSLGEVVAGVAHEINNPNAYITTNVSLLQDSWKDLKHILLQALEKDITLVHSKDYYMELLVETPDIINSINDGSKRIKNVVGNLKDFARINSPGKKSDININEVIDKSLTIIGANVRRLVKTINVNKSAKIPEVCGHFQKLEQVIINLVLNSSQAIQDKSKGKIEITTKYIKRLNCITVQVLDNGPGISEDLIPKLFDPFFTTRRDIGGSGLGLSISYEIMQEHNGFIAVHSKIGLGSKFTLFLPVSGEKLELNPKILCVDDGSKVPNMVKVSFLEETDKFFSFITEAAQVLNYILDHPEIDIIMMNVKYGNFSFELIKKIKEIDPLIEIIFYSEEDINPEENENVANINIFPFNIDILREKLNSVVRQKL